jgi:hypothetical protein
VVGSFAVQLARFHGAQVTATASTRNLEFGAGRQGVRMQLARTWNSVVLGFRHALPPLRVTIRILCGAAKVFGHAESDVIGEPLIATACA